MATKKTHRGGKKNSKRMSVLRRRRMHNTTIKSTMKSSSSSNKHPHTTKNNIVRVFMELLNIIKLYHWKTLSFAQHKATDDLHGNIESNVDKFVEILMGKDLKRLQMVNKKIESTLDVKVCNDTPNSFEEYKRKLLWFRNFLIDLDMYFDKEGDDTDLLNIRDEILGDLNQHLYLLAFK